MSRVKKLTVGQDDDGIRLDKWFALKYPDLPFGRLSKLLRTGQIRLDGARAKISTRIAKGQVVRVPPLQAAKPSKAGAPEGYRLTDADRAMLDDIVLYRDGDMLIIDKPAGLPVQGGTGITRNLDDMLVHYQGKKDPKPRLVHRLDKDTSGCLVIALNRKAAGFMAKAFHAKTTQKTYWALVNGVPEPRDGRIDVSLLKSEGPNEKMEISRDGKRAITLYRTVENLARRAAWVALRPVTGRTHQLRAHLAYLGNPVIGDGKYGGADAYLEGGVSKKLHLHARAIKLERPQGGSLYIEALLPPHMSKSWKFLGLDPDNVDGDAPFD